MSKQKTNNTISLEHRFNDDLLIDEEDRHLINELFPAIFHVLDHPELREAFLGYDSIANETKKRVQNINLLSLFLATTALLFTAITPLLKLGYEFPTWVDHFSIWAEVLGLLGAAIAIGGLWVAGDKKKWLKARMMAEVIRIWHFQSLICLGKIIEDSCNSAVSSAVEDFQKIRSLGFKTFLNEWKGVTDSKLEELIDSPEAGYQMFHEHTEKYSTNSLALEQIFSAYKKLRFNHQSNYINHKLQKSTDKNWFFPLSWPVYVMQKRTESWASFCLIGSLLISVFIVLDHFLNWKLVDPPFLSCATIFLLIFNVAIRAIQDGLAVPEELQRFNDYGGKIRYLLTRFEILTDPMQKLFMMEEMERAALQELKGFLRAYYEARFLI